MYLLFIEKMFLLSIPFFVLSSIIFMFSSNLEGFVTRLLLALVMSVIYRLLRLDNN